jgi:RNA polymerase sigma-70 factor (ECF subfamily)
MASRELGARVQAALARLSADQRLVVVLRHFLDLSYAEMSTVLLIPEKTVKSRLHSARERLAETLQDRSAGT